MNDHEKEAVDAFCQECVWVRSIRTHFSELFETSDERTELLGEAANTFFHDLNIVFIEYILLQQCKLTDPPSAQRGNSNNLTTNYLLTLSWSSAARLELEAENKKMLAFRDKIIDARRKIVAHLDLNTRLQPLSLGQFKPEEEIAFWEALQSFVNIAHTEAFGDGFDINASMPNGDALSLINRLKDSVDYDDLCEKEDGFLMRRVGKRRFENA
jgi:hypothetical protein